MLIRPASSEDFQTLIVLNAQLGYTITKEEISSNVHLYERMQGFVLVMEEENVVVGFISGVFIPLFHLPQIMLRITAMCVEEKHRNRGLGKVLLAKAEELSRKKGCYYIEVTSGPHRKSDAHVFYEQLGFTAYKGKRFTKKLEESKS